MKNEKKKRKNKKRLMILTVVLKTSMFFAESLSEVESGHEDFVNQNLVVLL